MIRVPGALRDKVRAEAAKRGMTQAALIEQLSSRELDQAEFLRQAALTDPIGGRGPRERSVGRGGSRGDTRRLGSPALMSDAGVSPDALRDIQRTIARLLGVY